MSLRDLTKFLAGMCAWESIVHASLYASKATPTVFGLKMTNRFNLVQAVTAGVLAVVLAWVGWSRSRNAVDKVRVVRERRATA